jgi:hypothetical protein
MNGDNLTSKNRSRVRGDRSLAFLFFLVLFFLGAKRDGWDLHPFFVEHPISIAYDSSPDWI